MQTYKELNILNTVWLALIRTCHCNVVTQLWIFIDSTTVIKDSTLIHEGYFQDNLIHHLNKWAWRREHTRAGDLMAFMCACVFQLRQQMSAEGRTLQRSAGAVPESYWNLWTGSWVYTAVMTPSQRSADDAQRGVHYQGVAQLHMFSRDLDISKQQWRFHRQFSWDLKITKLCFPEIMRKIIHNPNVVVRRWVLIIDGSVQLECASSWDLCLCVCFQVAMSTMDNPLLKYNAKEYFFKASLCHFIVDELNAKVRNTPYREFLMSNGHLSFTCKHSVLILCFSWPSRSMRRCFQRSQTQENSNC